MMSPAQRLGGRPTGRAHAAPAVVLTAGIATLALVVAGAIAAGWFTKGAVERPPAPPPPPKAVELGGVRLAIDRAWSRAAPPRGLGGLDAANSAVFEMAPGQPARAIVTLAPFADASLLPAPLRSLLPADLPAPLPATLLGLRAWRYRDLALTGGLRMEVTVVPTSAGALTVACVADATWATSLWCDSGLRGVSLGTARELRPAADLALRAAVPGVIGKIDRRRVHLRDRLSRATTRRGQARLAGRLARAFDAAAARLAPPATGVRAGAALIAGLNRTSAAYARLSGAARSNRPRRFRRAARAAVRGERRVRRALAAIG